MKLHSLFLIGLAAIAFAGVASAQDSVLISRSNHDDVLAEKMESADDFDVAAHSPGNPGTVSVDTLRMPPKAVHELEQSAKAYRSRDWRRSATHLEKVLAIYPQYTAAHDVLGRLYVTLHDYARALPEFEKAAAAEPRSAQTLHNLSATLLLLTRYSEAESAARATLKIDPVCITTRYVLACAMVAQGRCTPEATDLLRQSSSQIPEARLILARVFIKRGAVDEAEAELRAYLESPNASGKADVRCWLSELTDRGPVVARRACQDSKHISDGVPDVSATAINRKEND